MSPRRNPNRLPARWIRNHDRTHVTELYIRFTPSYTDILRASNAQPYNTNSPPKTHPPPRS